MIWVLVAGIILAVSLVFGLLGYVIANRRSA
jgi:hypothetical protein